MKYSVVLLFPLLAACNATVPASHSLHHGSAKATPAAEPAAPPAAVTGVAKSRDGDESETLDASGVYLLSKSDGQGQIRLLLEDVLNKTDRTNPEIDALVRKAFVAKLRSLDGYKVESVPSTVSAKTTPAVVAGDKEKNYHLQVTVNAPRYDNNKLTIALQMLVCAFPGATIQGEFAPKVTQNDTSQTDKTSETELIKRAVEMAVEKLEKYVAAL